MTLLDDALLINWLWEHCQAERLCCTLARQSLQDERIDSLCFEYWLLEVQEEGRRLLRERFDSSYCWLMLTARPCYVVLRRRVDILPDGTEEPWPAHILRYGSAWHCISQRSDSGFYEAPAGHPWQAYIKATNAELQSLYAQISHLNEELKGGLRSRYQAQFMDTLLERKLIPKRRNARVRWDELTDEERGAIRKPFQVAFEAELEAMTKQRDELARRRQALLDGQDFYAQFPEVAPC